jgi:hypothetical protein
MMGLFTQRHSISKLPIYPVRGNHECFYDDALAEVKLSKKYPNWKMDANWFEKTFQLNSKGEKLGMIGVDSCLAVCSAYGNNPDLDRTLLEDDEETAQVLSGRCEQTGHYHDMARKQMSWLRDRIDAQKSDSKLVWKTSYAHHPYFGLKHSDSAGMMKEFLGKAKSANHDVYFAGHEHFSAYAHVPSSVHEDDYNHG